MDNNVVVQAQEVPQTSVQLQITHEQYLELALSNLKQMDIKAQQRDIMVFLQNAEKQVLDAKAKDPNFVDQMLKSFVENTEKQLVEAKASLTNLENILKETTSLSNTKFQSIMQPLGVANRRVSISDTEPHIVTVV